MWMALYSVASYLIGVFVGRWYQRRRTAGAVRPADNVIYVYGGKFGNDSPRARQLQARRIVARALGHSDITDAQDHTA